jgi:predicted esterase YcpF (UPF0227 family)
MEYKYKSLAEFKKDNPSEYLTLKKRKQINKLCEDMGWPIKKQVVNKNPYGYWTKERCIENAKLFKTKVEWNKANSTPVINARKNGWFEECTAHMESFSKPSSYWTKERCIENAKLFKNKSSWNKSSDTAYKKAKKNGWFDECVAHMDNLQKPKGYWTLERCKEEALNYTTIKEWRKNNPSCYQAAMSYRFLNECTAHMSKLHSTWTPELCLEDALKYKTRFEWQKNSQAYSASRRFGCYDRCVAHMVEINKPAGYWTKERCMEEALKYTIKTQWQKKSSGSFQAAKRNSWIEEFTKHMKQYGKKI